MSEKEKIQPTKESLTPGGPKREDQHRARPPSVSTKESNSSRQPGNVASTPPEPALRGFTGAISRGRRGSLSLSPSTFRAALKSATQGSAAPVSGRKRPDTPGEGPPATGGVVGSGSPSTPQTLSTAAMTPSQHVPPTLRRGDTGPAQSGVRKGFSSRFRRASSRRPSQPEVGGATSREIPTAKNGGGAAGDRERGDSGSPPPPQRNSLRRRVSMSFSPSYLRRAPRRTPSHDSQRSITTRTEDSQQPLVYEQFLNGPGTAPPSLRVHPHPPGVKAAIAAANSPNRSAVRAAVRSATVRDSGETKDSEHDVAVRGRVQAERCEQPVVSTTMSTVAAPEPTPPPPLTYQQAQQRRRRSFRRSASFTAGTLRSVLATGESRGHDKKGGRARGAETPRGLATTGVATLDTGNEGSPGFSDTDRLLSGGSRRPSSRTRRLRGRSKSVAHIGRGSSAFGGFSNPPSPSSMRGGDGSGYRSGSTRSPALSSSGVDAGGANGGFRQRLRQRAAGGGGGGGGGFHRRSRTRSHSPKGNGQFLGAHARTISTSSAADLLSLESSGSWAGPGWRGFGGADGFGGERHRGGGVPSILDAVPAWKRPALLKGLQDRFVCGYYRAPLVPTVTSTGLDFRAAA